MGLVLRLDKPGKRLSKMFRRTLCCRKCGGEVVPLNSSLHLYNCDHCRRVVGSARIYYKLLERYKSITEIGTLLEDLGLFDNVFFMGKLATYVAAMHDYYSGGEGAAPQVDNYCLERN